jgi:hypothetical protein
MGLIQQGTSLSGAQAGRLFGSLTHLGVRGRVPFRRFTGFDSFPVGLGFAALIPSISTGQIASRVRGAGSALAPLSGVGDVLATLSVGATTTASPNMGVRLFGSCSGTGTVTVGLSAVGSISAFVRVGANPSAVDIAGELLDVQQVGGLTLRQALTLVSKIDKKASAIIGLSA